MRVLLITMLPLMALFGCSRSYYREQADKESYAAIRERTGDPRWAIPYVNIEPPQESRLHDPFPPDRPPMPPDDPAAHKYMHCVNGIKGYRKWHKDGDAEWIEDPAWRASLELDKAGVLVLTPDKAVEFGLIHSREYQTQLESVYLNALALTLNRFEFALHWFGTNDTTFTHAGSGANENNSLQTNSSLGFTRALAAGGQLMFDFANSFVFTFAGPDTVTASSNISSSLMQPLLRGFGRNIRLEGLTEAERNLLYSVRDFARFRKQFWFGIAMNQYLQLLEQDQAIRNQRANLEQLELNYRMHLAMYAAKMIASVKVDQVFQDLQTSRLGLIQSEAGLETSLDQFKIILGFPPGLRIKLDDALLNPFRLNDSSLTDFQAEVDKFQAQYRELNDEPPLAILESGFKKLASYFEPASKQLKSVRGEIESWKAEPEDASLDDDSRDRLRSAKRNRTQDLEEVAFELEGLRKATQSKMSALSNDKRKDGKEQLLDLTRKLSALANQLYVVQTQIRVYLIRLKPVNFELATATETAKSNRLDLMNQRAMVVDAWRQVGVAANLLKAQLDVVATANIATLPGTTNPFDFRSSASVYSVGVHFDSPLNREAERNVYRTSLINYQQARRTYMALEDGIELQIRQDLRQLSTQKINFEINRQKLISAARLVESAREELLLNGDAADPTSTLNILTALNNVLGAKNGLIASWISYETTRIQLLLHLEELQLDERGIYSDEHNTRTGKPAPSQPNPVKQNAQTGSGTSPPASS